VKSRPNYVAGGLSVIWLLIVGVPIYVMVSWSLQTKDSFLDRGGRRRSGACGAFRCHGAGEGAS